jgi:plasmid stabilization system protein ParE
MKYRIEISSIAEAEADNASLRLATLTSPKQASQWYLGLLEAIESLSQMPNRCSLARENENFSLEIRQLLYGRGRNLYRVLFTIVDGDVVSTVRILHIRHGLQKTIGEEDDDETTSI